MKRIAVFASGEGRAAVALASLFNEGNRIKVVLAISDRENSPMLEAMQELGVETLYVPREKWTSSPEEILDLLRSAEIDILVADGLGSLIPAPIFEAYRGAILAIFPSLTPSDSVGAVDSLAVQKEVIAADDALAGAVVCRSEDTDGTGTIILQETCDAGVDPETLAERVAEIERNLLPRAVFAHIRDMETSDSGVVVTDVSDVTVKQEAHVERDIPIDGEDEEKKDVSIEEQWADTLGIPYNPSEIKAVPPPVPGYASSGPHSSNPYAGIGNAPQSAYTPQSEIPGSELPPMPKNYLVWSVLCTVLCCFIPGIVAIIYSSQVSSRYYAHDYEGAKRSSEKAEIWIIVSFVLGLVCSTFYLPLMLIS